MPTTPTSERGKMTARVAEAIGRRFCINHNSFAEASGGRMVMKGKRKIWLCDNCIAKGATFVEILT